MVTALNQFVKSTSEHEHFLATRLQVAEHVPDGELNQFKGVERLPHGFAGASWAVHRFAEAIGADVIHAHSSLAGVMVRVGNRNRWSRRLIYSPHCFAFERRDISRIVRGGVYLAELVLSLNTEVIAACSHRERELAGRMWSRGGTVYIPNSVDGANEDGDAPAAPRFVGLGDVVSVAMLGRISPQKDPTFYVNVVDGLKKVAPRVNAQWIGGGLAELGALMEAASVTVSGWLPAGEAKKALQHVDVYVHTAAWEGFPMAILEAQAAGLLIVARDIPALSGTCPDWLGVEPDDVVERITALLVSPAAQALNRTEWSVALQENAPDVQRTRLLDLYARGQRRKFWDRRAIRSAAQVTTSTEVGAATGRWRSEEID
ncbi:glycosyltransferase [Cryobacterium sp. TMS1-20-1]|uniref:glycosyltransferase n=1 Tax=Cryobacterium sp. TMS1-20-1 TaxID=1259223 RepID=UPI00141AC1D6|nr:glycosyltransferase [Cryobacterium sp. TMS1-20-1]